MGKLYVRFATAVDCFMLWQWANDSEVRKNSFQSAKIPLVEHELWYASVLANPNILLYIMMEDEIPVGQIRLEKEEHWQVSYSIAPSYRGQGYGKIMFQLVENELIISGHAGEGLLAKVKADNIASQRIFVGLGYQKIGNQNNDIYTYFKAVEYEKFKVDALKFTAGADILLLSNNSNCLPLIVWLETQGKVQLYSDKLNLNMIGRIKPRLVISYNYRHIIKPEIIKKLQGKIINLHTSLLPWNRGSSPNLWSIIDGTPKGVTIHVLDAGLDTGDILLQKEMTLDEEKETLRSSYERLNLEIVRLLQDNWEYLFQGPWHPKKQSGNGSKHTLKDLQDFLQDRTFSYDMTIVEFKRKFDIKEKRNGTNKKW